MLSCTSPHPIALDVKREHPYSLLAGLANTSSRNQPAIPSWSSVVAESSGLFSPLLAVGYGSGWVVPTSVGALVLAAFIAVCWLRPYWLLRIGLWIVTHSIYSLRVLGRSNVPVKGAALLVCNHVSYVDWLLLMASQRRFIRFVVWAGFTKTWGLSAAFLAMGRLHSHRRARVGRAPSSSRCGPPATPWRAANWFASSPRAVSPKQALCCLFTVASSRSSKNAKPPSFPSASIRFGAASSATTAERFFGKSRSKSPTTSRSPSASRCPTTPKPPTCAKRVQKLSADCSIARSPQRVPVHRQFVRIAKRSFFRPCFSDSTLKGQDLTYGKTLAAVLCIIRVDAARIRRRAPMVGVWLPSSMGAAVANIVLAMLGKTSVNLNYTSAPDAVLSALRQCGCKVVLP